MSRFVNLPYSSLAIILSLFSVYLYVAYTYFTSIHPSTHTHTPIHLLVHPLTHPSIHPLTHPPTHANPSTHSSIHPVTHLPTNPHIHPHTHKSTNPPTHPSTHPPTHPYTHPYTHPPTHTSIHPPIHFLFPLQSMVVCLRGPNGLPALIAVASWKDTAVVQTRSLLTVAKDVTNSRCKCACVDHAQVQLRTDFNALFSTVLNWARE